MSEFEACDGEILEMLLPPDPPAGGQSLPLDHHHILSSYSFPLSYCRIETHLQGRGYVCLSELRRRIHRGHM